ncbi:MAG TPA: glutaminyl-peptide cyclotransferase [Caulobacter sp.]|nr:glutaminyl-peptide cyclotransferase [Caulobacter sp.]
MMRLAFLLLLLVATPASAAARSDPPIYDYRVVQTVPHDAKAYTQGLFFEDGALYESTGRYGESSIRKVDLPTGKVIQRRDLPAQHFGEGAVAWKGRLIQLTWQSQLGFVYDLKTFKPLDTFSYPGEGWGLTHDGRRLIMSDGTAELRFLDPETLRETGRLRVTLNGQEVARLNELEWVEGEVWANIWQSDYIARIDPATGQLVGWIDLSGLLGENRTGDEEVLNGIAYDPATKRLFVTGKLWPKLYEITLTKRGLSP